MKRSASVFSNSSLARDFPHALRSWIPVWKTRSSFVRGDSQDEVRSPDWFVHSSRADYASTVGAIARTLVSTRRRDR